MRVSPSAKEKCVPWCRWRELIEPCHYNVAGPALIQASHSFLACVSIYCGIIHFAMYTHTHIHTHRTSNAPRLYKAKDVGVSAQCVCAVRVHADANGLINSLSNARPPRERQRRDAHEPHNETSVLQSERRRPRRPRRVMNTYILLERCTDAPHGKASGAGNSILAMRGVRQPYVWATGSG